MKSSEVISRYYRENCELRKKNKELIEKLHKRNDELSDLKKRFEILLDTFDMMVGSDI